MITTYHSGKQQQLHNKELAETLAELRAATGANWLITEYESERRRGWFRRERVYFYELLYDVGVEYQVINFYRDGTDWSLNTGVPAELVMAYMLGAIGQAKARDSHA